MARVPAETWRENEAESAYLHSLVPLGKRLRLPRGRLLYQRDEVSTRFYLILDGQVKCFLVHHDGSERVLDIVGPGTLVGEGAAFEGMPRYSSAVVVQDAEVVEVDARVVEGAIASDPRLALGILRSVSRKERRFALYLEDATFFDSYGRVCRLLHRLMQDYPRPHRLGTQIDARLTHEQLASLTGTTRVTITRVMNQLRSRGIIDVVDGSIVVLDPKLLAEPWM